jgi:nitrite reductase/ring-hydroxylating ferredoxin subunit
MGQFVKVGTTGDFENLEAGKLVEAGGKSIALFKLGASYYAIENTCTHRGGPLADGQVMGEDVICPWHGARYSIKTGAVLSPPAPQGVKSFPVRVQGTDVEVEVD